MIIVDTSVALKWFNKDEEYSEAAFEIYKNHLEQKEQILTLDLFYIEAANALATKGKFSEDEIEEGLAFFYAADFMHHTVTSENILESATLARKYKTSVYDMLYAVIAKSYKILLITADERFAKKVGFSFVKTLSEISES